MGTLACGARSSLPVGERADDEPEVRLEAEPACGRRDGGRLTAYLEIVLDGSDSMNADNKWSAAVDALDQFFLRVRNEADPQLAVGLLVFEDARATLCTQAGCSLPGANDVFPEFVSLNHYDDLVNRIHGTHPAGSTPTAEALEASYRVLEVRDPPYPVPAGGRRFAMLISDGAPTTDSNRALDVARAKASDAPGIRTFSVGIGSYPADLGYDPHFMGELAIAGGTRASIDCETSNQSTSPCHFEVNPKGTREQLTKDFLTVFDRIRALAG